MKVRIIIGKNNDGAECQDMQVDGKDVCHVYPLYECPEDAIIGRDLVSCAEIATFMRQAYEAGKNGEEFMCEEVIEE
jgi:hypothetical protein